MKRIAAYVLAVGTVSMAAAGPASAHPQGARTAAPITQPQSAAPVTGAADVSNSGSSNGSSGSSGGTDTGSATNLGEAFELDGWCLVAGSAVALFGTATLNCANQHT